MKNTPKAFTLIELLVVIAVIGLLMSVIMPALGKVKDSAQALICGTNLRSYGAALQAYSLDNNDKAPFMVSWLYSQKTIDAGVAGAIPKECRWHEDSDEPDGSLWPYLSDEDVHLCPTFKRYANRLGLDGCPNATEHSRATTFSPNYSYSMNWFVGFDWNKYITMSPVSGKTNGEVMYENEHSLKLSRVSRSANCFAFSEENLWTVSAEEWDEGHGGKTYSSVLLNDNALWLNANKDKLDEATDNIATYHKTHRSRVNNGSANLVFVDGHVEAMRGRPGREAYETYGKPYGGHDNVNIW